MSFKDILVNIPKKIKKANLGHLLRSKAILKEENKILKARIQELENQQKPLIDLKNKYLAELRVKNIEIGRLKKLIER